MDFKEKVQSMKASEIVQAMIDGLLDHEKLGLRINMSVFSYERDNICFGCAASCTILKITDTIASKSMIKNIYNPKNVRNFSTYVPENISDLDFFGEFECAIDLLRSGSINNYNHIATNIGISYIPTNYINYLENGFNFDPNIILPMLTTSEWKYDIIEYQKFANWLKSQNL